MPIFEFHCEGCGFDFEQLVLSSTEKVACPKCKKKKVKKLMSSFGHKMGPGGRFTYTSGGSGGSGGGCSGCSGGSCSTCK